MAFLADHVWLFALLMAALVLFAAWLFVRSGDVRAAAVAALGVVGIAGLFLLASFVETPSEQVQKTLDRIVEAARQGDAETIVGFISNSYADGSRDKPSLAAIDRRHFSEARLQSVALSGVRIEPERTDLVVAKFVAHIGGEYRGQSTGSEDYPVRLRIEFRRESDAWRMGSIRRFDPIQSAKEISLDRVP